MFSETRRKIYNTLMIIAAALIALIMTPSIILFSDMFFDTYLSMAKNKLDRCISASRILIDSVMATTGNLALNPVIAETLEGVRSASLTSVLDGARTYSVYINAITVYGVDGKIFTSSGVINPPTVEELSRRRDIAEFFADDESSEYVSLRTSEIIKAYDNAYYNSDAGIISCCHKIYDRDKTVCGYIFSDIFPESLFENFGFSDDPRLKDSIAMIVFYGGYFASGNFGNTAYLTAAPDAIVENRLIVSSIRNFYGGLARIAVPVNSLYENIAIISVSVIVCGALLMTATHFIAKANASAVSSRLNGLLKKMTLSTERISKT